MWVIVGWILTRFLYAIYLLIKFRMIKLRNKKGDGKESNISLIVAVGLILILFGLAAWFFWPQIKAAFFAIAPTKVNVDVIKQQCFLACSLNSKPDYCCMVRNAVFKDNTPSVKLNCRDTRLKGECVIDCTGVVCKNT